MSSDGGATADDNEKAQPETPDAEGEFAGPSNVKDGPRRATDDVVAYMRRNRWFGAAAFVVLTLLEGATAVDELFARSNITGTRNAVESVQVQESQRLDGIKTQLAIVSERMTALEAKTPI